MLGVIKGIGHLLWDNHALFVKFKDVIDKLTLDDDKVDFIAFAQHHGIPTNLLDV